MTTEGSGSDGYVTAGEFDRDMDYIPTRVTENGEKGSRYHGHLDCR